MSTGGRPHPLLADWLELSPAVPAAPARVLVVGTLADADAVARRFPAAAVTGSPVVPVTGQGRYELVVAVDCLPAGRRARSVLFRAAAALVPGGTLLILAPAAAAEHLGLRGPTGVLPVAFDDLAGPPDADRTAGMGEPPPRWLRITYRSAATAAATATATAAGCRAAVPGQTERNEIGCVPDTGHDG